MNHVYMYCAAILVLVYIIMQYYYRSRTGRNQEDAPQAADSPDAAVCCGKHLVCEKQRLADAMGRKADYFEDEDLDRFRGHQSDDYSDDEIEEFRYVMYTMRPEEVREWIESLEVRQIQLPDELKDEACMMMEA